MTAKILKPSQIITGTLFNEPMRVETVRQDGPDTWVIGVVGTQSERFRSVTLTSRDIEALAIFDVTSTYDGDGRLLRLGLQAYSLGIAYEFDPYFGLSISRVDPLPHQLEAIYDYLLKLARVRFLLADDAGAGKTIMAGLLIRELKLRGLADRTLIVCPANLTFQWQRELNEKFDEKFRVLKGGEIRDQFGINQWLEQKQVITSLDLAKRSGIGESAGNVLLTPNEKRVAEDRRECYWLYVVTDCKSEPQLQNPIKDPARLQWHEVKKVDHYYLSIDAVTQPMQVREREIPYGDEKK